MPPVKSSLADQLQQHSITSARREPVWRGPCAEGNQGGITQGLIGRYLADKERFRIMTMEGLKLRDMFNHRLEYGNMWHVCEETLAKCGYSVSHKAPNGMTHWEMMLQAHSHDLCRRYPTQQTEVEKWYQVCKRQFPLYVKYWEKHPDTQNRTPLLQEQVFDVPYRLLSGRVVRLRGKWDSVDLVRDKNGAGIWLQENKTKGDIDQTQIERQLSFDLQSLFYIIALDTIRKATKRGVVL